MTHPEELLAGYVDGTLTEEERAVVAAHLPACPTCRQELELASRAITALSALEEESVPFGVTEPILAEARRTPVRRQPVWQRYQWAAGIAAAACLLLIAGVLLPQLTGGNSKGAGSARAPSAEMQAGDSAGTLAGSGAPVQTEVLDRNFDERDVKRLAVDAADVVPALPARDAAATLAPPDDATSCLVASGATLGEQDTLVRVIEARYLGTPAYLGVLQEGPGGGQPPERIVVWVVSSADCAILTLVSQTL